MKFLKALSLTFALSVLVLAMLGAGGKGNVMPATKSGRMSGERLLGAEADASVAEDAGKPSGLYLHSTKAGPMPLKRPPATDAGKPRGAYMNSTKSGELPLQPE